MLRIEPHLIELIQRMGQAKIALTIAGGLGIFMKHRWVLEQHQAQRHVSLIDPLPIARATDDIDAFLRLEIFSQPKRAEFRGILKELGYSPFNRYLQFKKQLSDDLEIGLDLLAPLIEDPGLKIDKPGKLRRLGPKDNKSFPEEQRLHAFATPEAFAVNERPQTIPLRGSTPQGEPYEGEIQIPHPFASLCMKIKAASDFERASAAERKPRGQKHAQDVYLLLAMLNETEWEECGALRDDFGDHPEFQAISAAVTEIFATPDQGACFTIKQTTPDADLPRFASLIGELFTTEHD